MKFTAYENNPQYSIHFAYCKSNENLVHTDLVVWEFEAPNVSIGPG
jgi:hypothetical protein